MSDNEYITVAKVSDGPGGTGDPGTNVTLPVVELLTGRGFVTGKSGSGKSNSASVMAEKLLDNGFGLLIVDVDGEYYGLKEEYEILHAGADEECDIQITADHAEKLASLALEQNVPIILDVSSYLDEDEAESVLTAVARHLFAKAKKQKQPFLVLVEEVHEYIPEKGSVGECGKMLIKIGKRGRKHGLGIVGISQRPADVKKDFITQCDWLVWHRLTWDNDTKVVGRILDGKYAEAVEDLDDGEGFLVTDWSGAVRRVQFQRKQTFDAGATPGLDDFERPDLKSVSDDLVSELEAISDEEQARDDRIAELREELDRKNSRISELEKELQDARDMSRMADQFVDALVRHVDGASPGETEQERMKQRRRRLDDPDPDPKPDPESVPSSATADAATDGAVDAAVEAADVAFASDADGSDEAGKAAATNGGTANFSASDILDRLNDADDGDAPVMTPEQESPSNDAASGAETETASEAETEAETETATDTASETATDAVSETDADDGTAKSIIDADGDSTAYGILDDEDGTAQDEPLLVDEQPLIVRELKADVAGLETKARKMLAYYREFGPGTPLNAHFAAGGDGDRTNAYAHNRTLRTRGLIEHVGRGHYDYCLRDLLAEELDGHVDESTIDAYARDVEEQALDVSPEEL
ncbi:MAG: putative nucleic acid-binding Zn finger protein [Haloarculaceae archaeon]|jgi:predicted nucleic acid-binding Zn finger protein